MSNTGTPKMKFHMGRFLIAVMVILAACSPDIYKWAFGASVAPSAHTVQVAAQTDEATAAIDQDAENVCANPEAGSAVANICALGYAFREVEKRANAAREAMER